LVARPQFKIAETSVGLSELDTIFHGTRGQFFLGWVEASSGNLAHGVARMRSALQEYRAAGSGLWSEYYLALIATALGQMKVFDEGLAAIDEAFGVIERGGARSFEAEVQRLKGEMLRAQDSSSVTQAEESFRTAIEISRNQNAKSSELRATTSLARLLRDTGRRDEACSMLSGIYGWFHRGLRHRRPQGRQGAPRRTRDAACVGHYHTHFTSAQKRKERAVATRRSWCASISRILESQAMTPR